MTIDEMRAAVAEADKKIQKKREQEKNQYISNRDVNISGLISKAKEINNQMANFKFETAQLMQLQEEALNGYGLLRSNSKGGFSISNASGTMKIKRRRDTEPSWDERGQKGIDMLKDFLSDTVKKRDQSLYEILIGFLEKNKQGDLEYSRVMELLKHEEKYTDQRWVEGLKLLKESYSNLMKGYGFQFYHKPKDGDKWEAINLSFASITAKNSDESED